VPWEEKKKGESDSREKGKGKERGSEKERRHYKKYPNLLPLPSFVTVLNSASSAKRKEGGGKKGRGGRKRCLEVEKESQEAESLVQISVHFHLKPRPHTARVEKKEGKVARRKRC